METVVDIVNAAINKDSIGLKHSLELDLSSRISDTLEGMRQDVASSLFGSAVEAESAPAPETQEGSE